MKRGALCRSIQMVSGFSGHAHAISPITRFIIILCSRFFLPGVIAFPIEITTACEEMALALAGAESPREQLHHGIKALAAILAYYRWRSY